MIRAQANQSIGAELVNATTGAAYVGTVTVYVTIDAGVQALGTVGSGVCIAEGNGYYTYRPSSAETDGALIAFTFIGTGAVPATIQVATVTAVQQQQLAGAGAVPTARFNANAVIQDAFLDLGVFAPGESIPPEDAQFALRALNKFISSLATQNLSFPYTSREMFTVVAGTSTYTIGPGGTFNTVRPQRLTGAALLYPSASATTGRIEVPIRIMTDEEYETLAVKEMQSAQFTAVHYDATYAAGFGSVFLWPTPNTALNSLVLYRGDQIQGFANLVTLYDFPPGYAELLQFNLEKRICRSYGKAREWGPLDEDLANNALRFVKRQNFTLKETALDGTLGGRGGYSILIGGW